MKHKDILPWAQGTKLLIPVDATSASEIAAYTQQLRKKEVAQVVSLFEQGLYEPASMFIWTKSMAILKRQLGTLGSDFIGEMLQRPDIGEHSDIGASITDFDAISLASDLGIVNRTEAVRLRNHQELITHFSTYDLDDDDDGKEMRQGEAIDILTVCVQNILGQEPQVDVAQSFVNFRKSLEEKTYSDDDPQLSMLVTSPYFYIKTTLHVILALLKTSKGAQLEHAVRNTPIILNRIWGSLSKAEKWQAGKAYAELYADGMTESARSLKKALSLVSGFDYVPENLRSNTFIRAAQAVLTAHNGMNNFYTEAAPMEELESLGTTIPSPALPKCMAATLSVYLGNPWGYARSAVGSAYRVLEKISDDRWEYYLNEALPNDRRILASLAHDNPSERWVDLVNKIDIDHTNVANKAIEALIHACKKNDAKTVRLVAKKLSRSI